MAALLEEQCLLFASGLVFMCLLRLFTAQTPSPFALLFHHSLSELLLKHPVLRLHFCFCPELENSFFSLRHVQICKLNL